MRRDRFFELESVLLEYVVQFGMTPRARRYYENFIERAAWIEAADDDPSAEIPVRFDA